MIDTFETYAVEPSEGPALTQPLYNERNAGSHRLPERFRLFRQVLRFGLIGGLNTLVDVLILNSLLLLFPTTSAPKLLAYNSLAYSLGAVNSFFLNKYWTFGSRQQVTRGEQARFILTTLCGIGWSSAILWLASTLLHPFLVNATLWANASKVLAIAGTALISYLGMRLWVFVSSTPQKQVRSHAAVSARGNVRDTYRALPAVGRRDSTGEREQHGVVEQGNELASNSGLSVVLPAYNEEQVIASTISAILDVLSRWHREDREHAISSTERKFPMRSRA